jgi:hypothetical protein
MQFPGPWLAELSIRVWETIHSRARRILEHLGAGNVWAVWIMIEGDWCYACIGHASRGRAIPASKEFACSIS